MKAHSPFPRIPGVLGIVCLLLAACTPQPAPTTPPAVNTERPTAVPPTVTPEPYTPGPVRWPAPPVLALITSAGGWGSSRSQLPTLVLYADGRLIRLSTDYQQLLEARLTQQQICDLLYQVEGIGFFDFVQGPIPLVYDVPTVQITVNAWHSRTVYTTGLIASARPEWITPSPDETDMPLIYTYFTLFDYLPPDLQPYKPDRLVLSIEEVEPDQYNQPVPWPLAALQLSNLAGRVVSPRDALVLDGDEVIALLGLFPSGSGHGVYQEGTKYYSLHSRPLLPLESPRSLVEMMYSGGWTETGQPTVTPFPPVTLTSFSDVRAIPDPSLNLPTVEFSCGRP